VIAHDFERHAVKNAIRVAAGLAPARHERENRTGARYCVTAQEKD